MTQRNNSAHTLLSRFWLHSLLFKSMSCIGVFSLLSGNLVLAQTESPIDPVISTPSQDSQSPTAAAPLGNSVPSAAPAPWQRLRHKLKSNSVKWQQRQTVRQHYSTAAQLRQARPFPRVVTPAAPPVSARPVVKLQTSLSSSLNQPATKRLVKLNPNSATDQNGAYIDPTDYKIGATTGYEAPKSVVLSERSTGCKALVRPGLSGSICNNTIQRSLRVARLVRSPGGGWLSKNRVARSGVRPIQVGPISVSANGFRVTKNSKTNQSVLSYYSRDFQPEAQPGNVDPKFMFPLTIPAPITSLFGWRIHPITGNLRFHSGTDLGAPLGTPVLAAYPGTVEIADYMGGYGLTVILNHNKSTLQTLYGHLSEIFVEPGESVEQGTVIGRVGSTGNSTGPHLHFETRQLTPEGWVATNPGVQLEYAFAHLVKALQTAHAKPGA